MDCKTVRESFWEYQQSQLAESVARSLRSHLESCATCSAELEQFKRVDRALDGLVAIEPSTYFDQKLNARLAEAERDSSRWGWVGVWLRDRYLWTFATLFLAVIGLWLGFRHQQYRQLNSMQDVVRIQDENLPRPRTTDAGPRGGDRETMTSSEQPRPSTGEEAIPDEDLAVVENFELLQDYDFLKDLATGSNTHGREVKTN